MTHVDQDDLLLEIVEGRIAVLTLNRPASRNALSNALFYHLIDTFETLEQTPEISVIILTGAGSVFCAGGDVQDMPAGSKAKSFDDRVADLRRRGDLMRQIAESSKLTIAAINGTAAGAGLSLALACDFRIAADSAKFVTAFIRMGLSGDCGCIHLLANLIGSAKAKELCFLSDPVSAAQAAAIGLIGRHVPDDDLSKEAMTLARRLAAGPTVAQRYMKENFRKTDLPLGQAIHEEALLLIQSAHSADHSEAKQAFLQKRPPVFTGV